MEIGVRNSFRCRINVLTKKRKPVDLIRGQIEPAVIGDESLALKIDGLLTAAGVAAERLPELRAALLQAFRDTMNAHLSDKAMPQKQETFEKILAWLISEPLISQSLRG